MTNGSFSLLQPTKFQLQFNRLPDVVYFCQDVGIPGGEIHPLVQPLPFKNRPVAGHKLNYEELDITFMVEEQMNSWDEIHKWMKDYATETGFQDYKNLNQLTESSLIQPVPRFPNAYCDATLSILSTQNNPIIRIIFRDCFPVRLGKIRMSTTSSAEETITCEASFGFWYYELTRLA